jgi:hypothetical protein
MKNFDPYGWARTAQGDDVFSPGDIGLNTAKQITALLKENKDGDVQEVALRVLNSFAAVVGDKMDFTGNPDLVRAAMTRMYVMGVEAMRLAIITDTEDDTERAVLIEKFKRDTIAASARNALELRHSKPGGSRAKREAIQAIWASGKYSSRDICAEQECAALEMSFSTARKALRNTPEPS